MSAGPEGPPDGGMRYELAGMLGPPGALLLVVRALPRARLVALDVPGIALLPVTAAMAADATPAALCAMGLRRLAGGTPHAADRRALLAGPESGFHALVPGLVALIEAASLAGPVAYVEADYVGREGRQCAAVWRSGQLVVGPRLLGRGEPFPGSAAPVSVALRALGVRARGRRDEFVVAGLGRHRSTEDWGRGSTG
ncbi:hypothetical protein [Pseudonocardia sp.]|uniref:hypothetical protein n=1 Tax=Pseudonocardia sp. TaxID=60912 RepID=UPI003D116712